MSSGRPLTDTREIGYLAEAIAEAGPEAYVAWDTESGASEHMRSIFPKAELHPYVSAYCTGISLCLVEGPGGSRDDLEGVYVPVGHERGNAARGAVRRLLRALNRTRATQITHHCLHDWPILTELGLGYVPPDGLPRRRRPNLDTQVVSWHQDENRRKGLKTLGEMYLDEDAGAEQRWLDQCMKSVYANQTEAVTSVRLAFPELPVAQARAWARRLRTSKSWGQLTVGEISTYAARDATLTAEVAEYLCQGHDGILHPGADIGREMKLQGVLYRLTKRGVSANVEQLDLAYQLYNDRADELQASLEHEHGINNPASSKQTAHLLYDVLGLPVMGKSKKTGAPSTDKNALEMLQGNPVAKDVLEYRKWRHAADSYAKTFANHARYSKDGRIHGHFSSTQTVTGRLSASGPNVMTIPRDDSLPEVRKAFYAVPPGIERLGFDINSAELWVTASITQDPLLTTTLLEGRNLHVETMLAVFGGESDKTRREYTLSKNVNFGIEYGAGLDQITIFAAKAGYSPRQARKVAKQMRDGHKAAYATQHRVAAFLAKEAERVGKLPLHVPGRYRHFWSPGRAVQYYTALNALVQGGVAEFMKDTMLALDSTWARDMLVLQVHDELTFDAPANEVMEAKLLELLTEIAHDLNPFRYQLCWSAKSWKEAPADG